MKDDFDFRFQGPGMYGDHFNNQFWLDEKQEYHRDDGPALVDSDLNKFWFIHGKQHRADDLPAAEMKDGTRGWFEDGKQHRDTGPAVINADGTTEWWIKGRKLSPEEAAGRQAALKQAELRAQATEMLEEFRKGLLEPITPLKPPVFTK